MSSVVEHARIVRLERSAHARSECDTKRLTVFNFATISIGRSRQRYRKRSAIERHSSESRRSKNSFNAFGMRRKSGGRGGNLQCRGRDAVASGRAPCRIL